MSGKLMTAKFKGTCKTCGQRVAAGDRIRYYGRGKGIDGTTCHPTGDNAPRWIGSPVSGRWSETWAPAGDDTREDDENEDGLEWSDRGQNGRGGYVTSGGRCEDAPCCGCGGRCGTAPGMSPDYGW